MLTPNLSGSILPGITRDSVIALAKKWDMRVSERKISIEEIFTASENGTLTEVFGSGTAAVISPVGEIRYGDRVIRIGDGTPGADSSEVDAIVRVFNGCLDDLHLFSSKAALGHLLSGASAIDMVLGSRMLNQSIIPAVNGRYEADQRIEKNLVGGEPLRKKLKNILINSQSYEGQCASIIIGAVEQ